MYKYYCIVNKDGLVVGQMQYFCDRDENGNIIDNLPMKDIQGNDYVKINDDQFILMSQVDCNSERKYFYDSIKNTFELKEV